MWHNLTTISQKISPGLRKIISNIGWLFADRILRMGVGLIIGAWIARYLGPQQFGLYNYAIAFVSLFGAIATLGLDQIVVRNLVREPSDKDEILGTSFVLKLIGGVVTVLLTTGTIILVRPEDKLMHWLVGITATGLVFQAFDAIDFWFQFQVQAKYTVVAKNTAFVLISIVKVSLLEMKAPLIYFVWAGLAETVVGAICLAISYRFSGQKFRSWRINLRQAKSLLKDSWPLIIAGLSIMIYVRIDMVMLGELADDQAVGIYAVATRLSELWVFIPTAIVSSVNPSIIEAKKESETLYYEKLQKIFNVMVVLAYAIAIPMTFFSNYVVVLIFGQNYAVAGGVLSIHIWGQLFGFLGIARVVWFVSLEQKKNAFLFSVCGAFINI